MTTANFTNVSSKQALEIVHATRAGQDGCDKGDFQNFSAAIPATGSGCDCLDLELLMFFAAYLSRAALVQRSSRILYEQSPADGLRASQATNGR